MGLASKAGVAVGVVALGAAAYSVGGDLLSAFNANAQSSGVQTLAHVFGAAVGGIGGLIVGYKATLKPLLFPKHNTNGTSGALGAALLFSPLALAATLLVGGVGGYGGYKASDMLIQNAVKAQQKDPAPVKP